MSTSITIKSLALAATLIACPAAFAGHGLSKSKSWSRDHFGVEIGSSGTCSKSNGAIVADASLFFRAELLGMEKKVSVDFEASAKSGQNGDREIGGDFLFGNSVLDTLMPKSISGKKTVLDVEIISKSKQFTVLGIPIVVMGDVSGVGKVSFEVGEKNRTYLSARMGAYGTLTAGVGTDAIGAGVYGQLKFGESRVTLRWWRKEWSDNFKPNVTVNWSAGDTEAGVKAWCLTEEAKKAFWKRNGYEEQIKCVDFWN